MLPDVVIAGAGLIGMACALECRRRGLSVMLLEKGRAGQEASWAAAGMLAARDPANPPALRELSLLSLALYPAFLEQLTEATGVSVPFETEWTLEEADDADAGTVPAGMSPNGLRRIREHSLDPRKVTNVTLQAVKARGVNLREQEAMQGYQEVRGGGVEVYTASGTVHAGAFVDCTGAWSGAKVRPAKGQMLRVDAPGALYLDTLGNMVVRTHDMYLVPRLDGTLIVGATVEDVGFDKTVHADDLTLLQARAAALLPSLLDAPVLEQWAGLRPATADSLPLLGPMTVDDGNSRVFVAAGHFRNGVLLAPATGHVVAQLLLGEQPSADLQAFAPYREAITGLRTSEARRADAARERMAHWRSENRPVLEPHERRAPMEPFYWYARVTGVPPGKERCSSIDLISFVWDAKRYVEEETVPDYLVLRWAPGERWSFTRGYLGSKRTRGATSAVTLAQVDAAAHDLTGGLLTPWQAVPRVFHSDIPGFAARQQPDAELDVT